MQATHKGITASLLNELDVYGTCCFLIECNGYCNSLLTVLDKDREETVQGVCDSIGKVACYTPKGDSETRYAATSAMSGMHLGAGTGTRGLERASMPPGAGAEKPPYPTRLLLV